MKLKEIQLICHKELDAIYGLDEVNSFFYLLIEAYYDFSRIQLALDPDFEITKQALEPLLDALQKLKQEEPIQYILGETSFFSLRFKVNEHTLIPRPETEELVQWILDDIAPNHTEKPISILDIGTGSGCIAIALAKHLPEAKVTALDVSFDALKVAKQNAVLNNVKIECIQSNILDVVHPLLDETTKFDIIVSNPPYVRNLEKERMHANVLKHEPHIALFVEDDNALQFYDAISEFAVNNLTEKGLLFFEINEYLGTEMKDLLEANNFKSIMLKQDIFGKDRMIKGRKN